MFYISKTTVFRLEYNLHSIMYAVDYYSRKWNKKVDVDDSALSEWVKVIRHLDKLTDLHDKHGVVPADKASNNVCQKCTSNVYLNNLV